MDNEKVKSIESSFDSRIRDLDEAIQRIGIRQDEIKSYIINTNLSIEELKQLILQTKSAETQLKIRIAIQKNTEIIAKLYDTISSFESIRQRYHQDISKLTEGKIRFIHVELRRIEEQLNSNTNDLALLYNELRNAVSKLSNDKETMKKVSVSIKDSPEYSMN